MDLNVVSCLKDINATEASDDIQIVKWVGHKALDFRADCFAYGQVFGSYTEVVNLAEDKDKSCNLGSLEVEALFMCCVFKA